MFTTEVWLTPILLLPGVALLTVSTAHRFGQIQAEFHRLLDHPEGHADILARSLVERARLYRDALASLYGSIGIFALASLLGGVVNLWRPESLWVVGGLTIAGIGAIVFSAVQLFRESLISLSVLQEQHLLLEESLAQRGTTAHSRDS
ncbi:MAG: DUF2721 domain-containing protein [Candidatus Binatia bacterium]